MKIHHAQAGGQAPKLLWMLGPLLLRRRPEGCRDAGLRPLPLACCERRCWWGARSASPPLRLRTPPHPCPPANAPALCAARRARCRSRSCRPSAAMEMTWWRRGWRAPWRARPPRHVGAGQQEAGVAVLIKLRGAWQVEEGGVCWRFTQSAAHPCLPALLPSAPCVQGAVGEAGSAASGSVGAAAEAARTGPDRPGAASAMSAAKETGAQGPGRGWPWLGLLAACMWGALGCTPHLRPDRTPPAAKPQVAGSQASAAPFLVRPPLRICHLHRLACCCCFAAVTRGRGNDAALNETPARPCRQVTRATWRRAGRRPDPLATPCLARRAGACVRPACTGFAVGPCQPVPELPGRRVLCTCTLPHAARLSLPCPQEEGGR